MSHRHSIAWGAALLSFVIAVARSDAPSHWAFQPVKRPHVPDVKNRAWVRNPLDAFVLARLETLRITPSPEADRPTLIRRLSLDLLGLPPTPTEVDAFVDDKSFDAYEKLVDRLLASPHFGERWGRHWLDLARYADSDGYEKDSPRPFAWVYRNWVIDALNHDLPFDQFTIEQLAGDLLPNATLEQKIATGFHRNTLTNREGGVDQEEYRVRAVKDRVDTTGVVWLGLTIGCANCHNHKYDPITQKEYYQFFAFYNVAQEVDVPTPTTPEEVEEYQKVRLTFDADHTKLQAVLVEYETNALPANLAKWEQGLKSSRPSGLPDPKLPATIAAIIAIPTEQRTDAQRGELKKHYRSLDPQWVKLNQAVTDHAKKAPAPPAPKAMTFATNPSPPKTFINIRGDFLRKGDEVEAYTPAVLHRFTGSEKPSRLDLARWIVDSQNPLTSRVHVNRIWMYLFGRALVPTTNDFGTRGEKPSHRELLDWLASEFVKRGWSQKQIIKLIVMSSTYRQSSRMRADLMERDPKNVWLARQNRFRLEAEGVRDVYLAASGLLNEEIGGPSIRPPLPADVAALGYANSVKWPETKGTARHKRGLYIFFQRTVPYPMLSTFDSPDGNVTCTRRERSNTPLQALTLLNDPVFVECAQALGRRIGGSADRRIGGSADRRIKNADRIASGLRDVFRLSLAREPTKTELTRLTNLFNDMLTMCRSNREAAAKLVGEQKPDAGDIAEAAAWVAVARTILNLDEFVTRE